MLISILLATMIRQTHILMKVRERECEQETLFGGLGTFSSLEYHVEELYHVLSEDLDQYLGYLYLYKFQLINGELYSKGKDELLITKRGMLRSVDQLKGILGVIRLCELGFNISKDKVMARQAIVLNRVEEELPFYI